jgi:hypothetical protein
MATTETWTYTHWLAERTMTDDPTDAPCRTLTEVFRHGHLISATGVPDRILLEWARAYARRVDQLGPEEFDLRSDLGL